MTEKPAPTAEKTPADSAIKQAADAASAAGWAVDMVLGDSYLIALNPLNSAELWMFFEEECVWKRRGQPPHSQLPPLDLEAGIEPPYADPAVRIQELEEALRLIDRTLQIPAAEHVPVIGDVFTIVDRVLKGVSNKPGGTSCP